MAASTRERISRQARVRSPYLPLSATRRWPNIAKEASDPARIRIYRDAWVHKNSFQTHAACMQTSKRTLAQERRHTPHQTPLDTPGILTPPRPPSYVRTHLSSYVDTDLQTLVERVREGATAERCRVRLVSIQEKQEERFCLLPSVRAVLATGEED